MATFCCPIENEPKTLNQVVLNQAREVAVGVLKDNEPAEASRVMNEGRKPMMGPSEMAKAIERADSIHKLQGNITTIKTVCECTVTNVHPTPDQCNLKDPHSAPF